MKILCGLKHDLVAKADMSMSESRDSEYGGGMEMMQMRGRETLTAAMNRRVSTEEAQKFALRNKMFYMELSAKTGHNVNELFFKMATEVNENWKKKQIEQ